MRRVGRGARASMATAAAVVGLVATTASPAGAITPRQERFATRLVNAVDVGGANRHLRAYQRIADTYGDRAAGRPGYEATADYVEGLLDDAGFIVERQEFEFEYFELVEAAFEGPDGPYVYNGTPQGDFVIGSPSGNGDVTAALVPIDVVLPATPAPSSTSGCEASDFTAAGFEEGDIALIQRGTCTFAVKVANAEAAGAAAVVLFNEGQPGRTAPLVPSLDAGVAIPVVFTSYEIGAALAATPGVEVRVATEAIIETRTTSNLIAQTRTGRTDNVIVAGAHIDGIQDGPGMNDNGSGSAALLETALELGSSPRVNNAVRFTFWGAEEDGLLGAEYYASQLDFEEQLDIAMYLNFDMIGSANAGYFVYDGDNSDGVGAGPGPYGSAQIEATFVDFLLDYRGVPTEGTDFDGRSDYGPFIALGIPSGGLFTGAEGIKTAAQAAKWGGTAGAAYDPCYHQACDNLGNIDRRVLDRNLDAMAWAVGVYAISTEDVNGESPRGRRAAARAAEAAQRTAVDSEEADATVDAAA